VTEDLNRLLGTLDNTTGSLEEQLADYEKVIDQVKDIPPIPKITISKCDILEDNMVLVMCADNVYDQVLACFKGK
jgi:hypothetical protein